MKTSIITPTHKAGPHLLELYQSILSQDHTNWEWIILLNNGPKLLDLQEEIKSDSRVFIHTCDEENTSVGFLKNKAFNLATGEILVEVDHDDLLIKNCLSSLVDEFKDESVGFVYSNDVILPINSTFEPYAPIFGWRHCKYRYGGQDLYQMQSFPPTSHAFAFIWYAPDHVRAWRNAVYKEIGGHNPKLSVCDDHELMIRTYLHKSKIVFIDEPLYIYRKTGDNTSILRNAEIQKKTIELHKQYAQLLAEKDADLAGLLKIDLGGGIDRYKDYVSIDAYDGDIICDLNNEIPLEDNSVGVINASHILEHLYDKTKIMSEIHRVLAHGGWAFIEVPSTQGNGAWSDPTHVSYWNEDSFAYYTQESKARYIRNKTVRFMSTHLETYFWVNTKIAITRTFLVAIKDGPRLPGLLQI